MAGLVIAGVLASAMGTLSSAISSLASSTYPDLFRLSKRARAFNPRQEMFWSRAFTLFWGLALIGGAMLFTDTRNPVVELGLRIASVTYGSLLGIFFLGLLSRRPKPGDAFAGFLAGIVAMALILMLTQVDYTWHTLIGCLVTVGVGHARARLRG